MDWIAERPVQLQGSALARGLLRACGWRIVFDGLPAQQGVIVVYPHTSNWDFPVGLLAKWGIGIPLAFWGKDSLFRMPLFGAWMRWVGGRPIDRSAANGAVGQMARELREARERGEFLWLALAPEGTRSYVDGWRSGFYHLTLEAGVPLGLAHIDYATKTVGIEAFGRLGGDIDSDIAQIAAKLSHHRGRRPEKAAPIRIRRSAP